MGPHVTDMGPHVTDMGPHVTDTGHRGTDMCHGSSEKGHQATAKAHGVMEIGHTSANHSSEKLAAEPVRGAPIPAPHVVKQARGSAAYHESGHGDLEHAKL
mmetsp:Transcript_22797/g.45728  ORF Transcript_22797/g.45728 Transcript_22797/m.45728 type:complete len:101 (-) Transcript_22797:233-535(-)